MLLAMFDFAQKICQMFSSDAVKLMFGVQKKYILFMCMVVIRMSMPKSLTVTNHLHLLLLSSEVYVGLYSDEVCLSFVFPLIFPYSFSHSSHMLPSFLLNDIVLTLLFLASLSYLLTAVRYWQNIYNPKFILNFIAWTLLC